MASPDEIRDHLSRLGGNLADNLLSLGIDPVVVSMKHYFVSLREEDFLGMVFLQNDHVRRIVPNGSDRSLSSVVRNAIVALQSSPFLHSNWQLDKIYAETIRTNGQFKPLALRDSKPSSELPFGEFYLQDGCHRALGYAMALNNHTLIYEVKEAYLSTRKILNIGLII